MAQSQKVDEIISKAYSEGRSFLLEYEAKQVVSAYGLNVTKNKVASSLEEALKFAEEIGYPVVLKIVSPDVLHKSDAGGVKVGLNTPDQVKEAYRSILDNVKKFKSDAKIVGVLVQEMAPMDREVIIGMIKDPQFGPAVMFGLGGIFVEVLKDVSFRVAPITEYDAKQMIQEIKALPILKGVRGKKPVDFGKLTQMLLNVSKLVIEHPEIEELDLNPVVAYPDDAIVLDARIILAKRE
ncbi:MAG: acetate--CoA ligase family protein [Candidatus Ranarchaeia archaeon]